MASSGGKNAKLSWKLQNSFRGFFHYQKTASPLNTFFFLVKVLVEFKTKYLNNGYGGKGLEKSDSDEYFKLNSVNFRPDVCTLRDKIKVFNYKRIRNDFPFCSYLDFRRLWQSEKFHRIEIIATWGKTCNLLRKIPFSNFIKTLYNENC